MAGTAEPRRERGGFSDRMRSWWGGTGPVAASGTGEPEAEDAPFAPPEFLSEDHAATGDVPQEALEALEMAMSAGDEPTQAAPSPEEPTEAELFRDSAEELLLEACEKFKVASETFSQAGELLKQFAERQTVETPVLRDVKEDGPAE